MRNVAGISQTDAQKSSDMFMKCRYMDELTGGRGITFATGTPVSVSYTHLLNDSESEMAGITIRDKKTMSYLQEWMGKKQKLGDGRITEEEYLEWKLHWPEDKRKTEYKKMCIRDSIYPERNKNTGWLSA